MNKYLVRYYDRNPLDPQDRWSIQRGYVDARDRDEAQAMIEGCDCEVIDVEIYVADADRGAVYTHLESLVDGDATIQKVEDLTDAYTHDPRTAAEHDLDEWQAETQATRETERPI